MKHLAILIALMAGSLFSIGQGPTINTLDFPTTVDDSEIFLPVLVSFTGSLFDVSSLTWSVTPDPGGIGTQTTNSFVPSLNGTAFFTIPLDPYNPTDIITISVFVTDDAGVNSDPFQGESMFEILPDPVQPTIAQIEYQFDGDDGFGNGITLPNVPSGLTQIEELFQIPTSGLAPGEHTLFLRTQDTNGEWSVTSFDVFIEEALVFDPQCIDYDGDGNITSSDFLTWLSFWGMQTTSGCAEGDFDGDGNVNVTDLFILLQNLN